MRAPCGCTVAPDPASGILRSLAKCAYHRRAYRDPATLDEAYHRELGVFGETAHLPEILEALGPFPAASGTRQAIEIGCGCSPYVGAIKAAGWRYTGIDSSPFAARWTAQRWSVDTIAGPLASLPGPCGLILAAHVVEHLDDAPGSIVAMAAAMEPGGELWIVVPDDSDLANPDHLWSFDQNTLKSCIESAGLAVEQIQVRRYVPHENFIYARAIKAGRQDSCCD